MKADDSTEKETRDPHSGTPSDDAREPLTSTITGAANKANRALSDTAQTYLDAAQSKVSLENLEKKICDRPRLYLALAAGTGFVLSGGLATRAGLALLALFGRRAAGEAATKVGQQFLRQAVRR